MPLIRLIGFLYGEVEQINMGLLERIDFGPLQVEFRAFDRGLVRLGLCRARTGGLASVIKRLLWETTAALNSFV